MDVNSVTEEIMGLLNERIGLDTESVGRPAVDYALRIRMAALHIERLEQYGKHLSSSPEELQQLIETVIVPETWFFRHAETFDEMVRFVMDEWPRRYGQEGLKALSLPCSTGEEPYSMVMALLDAGFPLQRLHVDAMDISRGALEHAREGLYRPYSFRSKDLRFRDQYFTAERGGFRLHESLRRAVNFHQGNALDLHASGSFGSYDIIFCRNLLIYLDHGAQEKVVANLAFCLQPEGRLFSSPAEHAFYADSGFESISTPAASVFHRTGRSGKKPLPERRVTFLNQQPRSTAQSMPPLPRSQPVLKPVLPVTSVPLQPAEPIAPLEQAASLADAGRLQEAHELCVRHMSENGESAQGFYLLGLISDTRHDAAEAEKLYRKALYLEPGHLESLLHLAWLCDSAGDSAQAKQLRARALRAQERKS